MPELPEVEAIVRDLNKEIIGRKILNAWTDFPRNIKFPKTFEEFKRKIKDKKIEKVWRRGKNIIIELSGGLTLLIHQKLTGHLLIGKWKLENRRWVPLTKGPLEEPVNKFIHLIFWLDNEKMLVLSDLRKFAKVMLVKTKKLSGLEDLKNLGPEPLEKSFSFEKFKKILQKSQGKIKQVLMDQSVIAGIGNIYSDEILWKAKIHPFKEVKQLSDEELKKIYLVMREILLKAMVVLQTRKTYAFNERWHYAAKNYRTAF